MTVLSKNITHLRVDNGKEKEEVAAYLDITVASYNRYEAGTREPDIDKLLKLADYFRCSVDYLLGRPLSTNVDLVSRDRVFSYKDIVAKGYNGKLAHGLIKQIYDKQSADERAHVSGDDTIKYVLKEDVQTLLEMMKEDLSS